MIPKMTITDASQFLDITPQGVMKKIKNLKLPYCKSQNRIYFGYETSKELFNISIKPKILAFQIVKGGTGKSNISLNFAIRANLYGLKVLCIDLDQQANLTTLFDIDAQGLTIMHDIILSNGKKKIEDNLVKISEGLHLFPSSLENAALDDEILVRGLGIDRVYKDIFEPLREYYDLIIIDCPPALGRSVGAAACAADEVIAPVIPDKLCLRGLQLLEDSLKELEEKKYGRKVPFKIVFNKFDSRTNLSKEILAGLFNNKNYKDKLNDTYIRTSQDIPNACANKVSLFDSLKPSFIKEDIDLLTRDLLGINIKNKTTKQINKKVSVISAEKT
jgi:chromosome partitioning protein